MPRKIIKISDIRAEAKKHTHTALKVLVGVATNKDSQPSARVAAATSLLDRGWGKPPQAIVGDKDAAPIQFVDVGPVEAARLIAFALRQGTEADGS